MISTEQSNYRILFSKIAAILLLVAIIPIWPYFLYQFLKLVVFGAASFSVYLYHKEKNTQWMIIMIIIAIIFNPINPLYFGHFLWSIVDLIVAMIFFKSPKAARQWNWHGLQFCPPKSFGIEAKAVGQKGRWLWMGALNRSIMIWLRFILWVAILINLVARSVVGLMLVILVSLGPLRFWRRRLVVLGLDVLRLSLVNRINFKFKSRLCYWGGFLLRLIVLSEMSV